MACTFSLKERFEFLNERVRICNMIWGPLDHFFQRHKVLLLDKVQKYCCVERSGQE